jgi:hypothetical protein
MRTESHLICVVLARRHFFRRPQPPPPVDERHKKFQLPSVTPISSVTVSGRCVLVVFAFVSKTEPSPIRLFDWEFESVKFYCFISPP